MSLAGLETPVVTLDLDVVERNIAAMQRYCDEHGLALRPHIKTHKSIELAQKQLDAGAAGICCQKLGEAETMLAAGIRDITIPYPLVGAAKAERLARLALDARVTVAVDSEASARDLSAALDRAGAEVDVLVDCDTGFGRTGVQSPEDAAALARTVASLPGLRFVGLMTYPTLPESAAWLRAAREAIEAGGLRVERVSGGGTPGARFTHDRGEVNELRVGTYVFGDRACLASGSATLDDCALRVVATVVSRPTATRAIVDAGTKTLTSDPARGETGFGLIVEHPEAVIYELNEEHGLVDLSACAARPAIGDIVTIVPNHACGATNLHDELVVHRGGTVEGRLRVAARGLVR
jgi:D-serine deaminase-like pyridoxal phosphate-dependent protein